MRGKSKDPLRTLLFRASPERTPSVWRIIEIVEKQTLHDLHKILYNSFDLKGKHLYAFYLSGKRWDPDTEYGGPLAGTPRKAIKATLSKLDFEKGRVFLYLFDFIKERGFKIEWIDEQTTVPKTSYPRVIEAEGELPAEEPPLEDFLPDPIRKWMTKIRPVIETWVLMRFKSRGPKDVDEAYNLYIDTYDVLEKMGAEAWPLMEEATGMLLVDWLLSLPEDFAKRSMSEEALELCDDFSPYADAPYFQCEKALVYAQMGRRERALHQLRENLTQYPEDARVVTKSAEAFWRLEEVGHAERLFRKALDMADDDINERERILEKLVAMLQENERDEEVTELIRSELDRG